jgi:hypothetical protein
VKLKVFVNEIETQGQFKRMVFVIWILIHLVHLISLGFVDIIVVLFPIHFLDNTWTR